MSTTIFFSWQSDRPQREGRNLVENALKIAIERLSQDLEVEESIREDIQLDKDTKSVPGSPPIFDTILRKIEKAAIFIPDLTFVGKSAGDEPIPNPNVLIEYGFALRTVGYHRIVGVMNAAYGPPESLPFDLIHHRFPITYTLPEGASDQVRREQRSMLARILEKALKDVLDSDEYRTSLPKTPEPIPVTYRQPLQGRARFRSPREPIGIRADVFAHLAGEAQGKLSLSDGASMWLRVGPQFPAAKPRKIMALESVIPKLALLPFYDPGPSIGGVRGPDGCGFYHNRGPEEPTPSLVYVFTDDEIWTINTVRLAIRQDLLLLEENQWVQTLGQCIDFLHNQLGVKGPYRCVAGVEEVLDRHLREDNFGRRSGLCSVPTIEVEEFFKLGDDPRDVLEPFFEEVLDKCGLTRLLRTTVT